MLSWALCISTINRLEILESCIQQALAQSRPPCEIIVVDASDDWQANAAVIAALVTATSAISLHYGPAPARSLPAQRNAAIAQSTADILFMIDDDALMYPDCAAAIMAVYEADRGTDIAAVGATAVSVSPVAGVGLQPRFEAGLSRRGGVARLLRRSALFRWAWREILLMPLERKFIRYDPPRHATARQRFERLSIADTILREVLEGFTITVRRDIALKELFDDGLIGSGIGEDLDATYRFSRHGLLVQATRARLYHHVIATGRVNRRIQRTLEVLNPSYFVRRHVRRPGRAYGWVLLFALRYLFATTLKDIGARRFNLPEARGVLFAIRRTLPLFLVNHGDLKEWYRAEQRRIMAN